MANIQTQPTYTNEQVEAYFNRLQVPRNRRQYDAASLTPEEQLEYLTVLLKHHFVRIPFENLSLHYSQHRQISTHPEELFNKIIGDNNGRGGYCMENNCLFATLLRSLGFKLFSAGARVFDGGKWSGWSHMVNIVTIGNKRYHTDVGFGANGPIVPMELDKSGPTQLHIYPATARLQWDNIPGNTDEHQRLWIYQHRINNESDFQTTYCFTELEFLPIDYSIMNYYTSTCQRSFFTRTIIGEKKLVSEDGETLIGNLILGNGDIKWRVNGVKEKEIAFASEEDRLKALEEHFGIHFSQSERDGIRGLASELK
ncbi:cysteine proteinase [Aaosphaeria arxii CBS 175.79]|uniref:Cysteine proteinase n=1 Tax=Aaosphaeria arxii CBS 175.79 TaxID=1450172 RepID=A0A6A5Y7F9_9PLEO|nr:cysteine proteinase [Aaosphaeria arxii CBS 175.79]KAF2020740.1 cysteine proteinase [Aaosphaeria arxii CBS 175.79]